LYLRLLLFVFTQFSHYVLWIKARSITDTSSPSSSASSSASSSVDSPVVDVDGGASDGGALIDLSPIKITQDSKDDDLMLLGFPGFDKLKLIVDPQRKRVFAFHKRHLFVRRAIWI
jgi:hypothetical protein